MAWITVPGLAGKVYQPDDDGSPHKKHPCLGCFACQWCDEARCRVCRGHGKEAAEPAPCRTCPPPP